jgi:hypothetical protein
MRKITENATNAFMAGRPFAQSNTAVMVNDGEVIMSLHGHPIAKRTEDGALYVRSAGWETTTTKERLNGVCGVSVNQKNWQWYLNGAVWHDSSVWTLVTNHEA